MDIQSEEFFQSRTSPNILPYKYRKVLIDYYKLAAAETLSDSQALRMQEILQVAEVDSTLSILLNEIDEITYQGMELDNLDFDEHINDEISKVQEMIPGDIIDGLIRSHLLEKQIVRVVASQRVNPLRPGVEVLSDVNLVHRVRFEKAFSSNVVSMHSSNDAIPFFCSGKSKASGSRVYFNLFFLKHFLLEESVSLFMGVFLALLILLLFL